MIANTDHKPFYITAKELSNMGIDDMPSFMKSSEHLIYSSPAAQDFNSPGAEGFGVKRAGLAVPGSVMLIVSPGCCGRNTSLISRRPEYDRRFFYYNLEEKDVITGRHLTKIPQAAAEIIESLDEKPSALMICITCVDALLGTDMERICRKVNELIDIPVRPCYMYALTREGSRPPMVHVRQSIYGMLKPMPKKPSSVNIIGYFSPLGYECELKCLLGQIGVKKIRQISECKSYDEFTQMAEANFNLLLNPQCRAAAVDMSNNLNIPYIELARLYDPERIHAQYKALGRALNVNFDDSIFYQRAHVARDEFSKKLHGIKIAIGERLNADSFELALALTLAGAHVTEIYSTVTNENFIWIRTLSRISPETKVFSNLEPSMIYYDETCSDAEFFIGADAGYYHTRIPGINWNSEVQPFGYGGVCALYREILNAL